MIGILFAIVCWVVFCLSPHNASKLVLGEQTIAFNALHPIHMTKARKQEKQQGHQAAAIRSPVSVAYMAAVAIQCNKAGN